MKRMMLTGAILGFASGIGLAWHNGLPMQEAFWHACIGAYLGGMLLRWWGSIWFRGLRQSYQERLAAMAAAAEAAENSTDQPLAGR